MRDAISTTLLLRHGQERLQAHGGCSILPDIGIAETRAQRAEVVREEARRLLAIPCIEELDGRAHKAGLRVSGRAEKRR